MHGTTQDSAEKKIVSQHNIQFKRDKQTKLFIRLHHMVFISLY